MLGGRHDTTIVYMHSTYKHSNNKSNSIIELLFTLAWNEWSMMIIVCHRCTYINCIASALLQLASARRTHAHTRARLCERIKYCAQLETWRYIAWRRYIKSDSLLFVTLRTIRAQFDIARFLSLKLFLLSVQWVEELAVGDCKVNSVPNWLSNLLNNGGSQLYKWRSVIFNLIKSSRADLL